MSGIELEGFDHLFGKLKNAPQNFEKLANRGIGKTAHLIRSKVIKGINSQAWASNWSALSPEYADRKKKLGGGSKMLISGIKRSAKNMLPGYYRNSFATENIQSGVWIVGSNYPQARALEFGYSKRNLPARPHLKFAVKESEEDFMRNVLEAIKGTFE